MSGIERTVSFSTSPSTPFHAPFLSYLPSASGTGAAPKQLKPFNTNDIKILLLENVNESGKSILVSQGYQVEHMKSSLPEDQLIERIRLVLYLLIKSAWLT